MIHYALKCARGHSFDGWFRSSSDFDRQQDGGLLSCPVCGTHDVSRALMAPAVRTAPAAAPAPDSAPPSTDEAKLPATTPEDGPATTPSHAALADPQKQQLVEALQALRKAIVENGDNVGQRFPEEARRIHYGETEARGIYGQASEDEAQALLDEGIDILPVPILPEDRN